MVTSTATAGQRRCVVYYHRSCPDGATAAWIAREALHTAGAAVQLIPMMPDALCKTAKARGAEVFLIDVCVPGPQLDLLASLASQVIVLDHHLTSKPYAEGRPWVHIDTTRSGAMLAWRHFHGDAEPPTIVRYVEDMDLWRNALPQSRDLQMLLRRCIRPDQIATLAGEMDCDLAAVVARGEARREQHDARVDAYLPKAAPAWLGETQVTAVRLDPADGDLGSDVANAVATAHSGIAVAWRLERKLYRYSVRSMQADGPEVASLAQRYGGGGHAHAAGFTSGRQVLASERP